MNIVAEVVNYNASDDVLGDIVPKQVPLISVVGKTWENSGLPGMAHMRGIIYSRTAVIPLDVSTLLWYEGRLCSRTDAT